MDIIITQTLRIVRHTGEMIKLHILRFLKVLIKSNSSRSCAYPQTSIMIGSNETRFVARINRISLQIVPVIDKQRLSCFILRNIIDTSGKSSYPDTTIMIFIDTIHIVIAQTVHIFFTMKITGQFIRHSVGRSRLGTDKSVSFCCNPDHSFRILNNKINSSQHGSTSSRNDAAFGQISLIIFVGIIHTKHTVFQTDPQITQFVFTQGTHLIMQ